MIHGIIADDHSLIRQGVRRILERLPTSELRRKPKTAVRMVGSLKR